MADLWKHFNKEHLLDVIISLRLFGDTEWLPEKQLACLYVLSNHTERHYTPCTIAKQDGTMRTLLVPDPLLKKVQKNILSHVLDNLTLSSYATAYRKNVNIVCNASPHSGQRQLLNMDIQHFFDSISYPMIQRSAFPHSIFPPAVAALLTHLCCYQDYLPQGAPTSPTISNLVMKSFDDHMGDWCTKRHVTYTRYCDDMTFSGDFDVSQMKNKVRSLLCSMGFEVNEKKTRLQTCSQRQSVTGIVVNDRPQVSREYRNKLRQELYYCIKYGAQSHLQRMDNRRDLLGKPEQVKSYLLSLLGKINYVLQVDPQNQFFRKAKDAVQKMLLFHC